MATTDGCASNPDINYITLTLASGVATALPFVDARKVTGIQIAPDGLQTADSVTSFSVNNAVSPATVTVTFASGVTRVVGLSVGFQRGSY